VNCRIGIDYTAQLVLELVNALIEKLLSIQAALAHNPRT
jgi:hypothetical protein